MGLIAASAANHAWALDFISDRLASERQVRVLSVVDRLDEVGYVPLAEIGAEFCFR